jgi:hypothetical protein
MILLEKISKFSKDQFDKISKQINLKKDYIIFFEKVNKETKLVLRDKKTNEIIVIADFHFFGYYDTNSKLWYWANIIDNVTREQIKFIEKLRAKAYLIEKNINSEIDMFFYQFLSNDVYKISDNKQLALIIDLLIYLTGDYTIFTPYNSMGHMEFISISKVNELNP